VSAFGEAARETLGGQLPGVLAEYVCCLSKGALAYPAIYATANCSRSDNAGRFDTESE